MADTSSDLLAALITQVKITNRLLIAQLGPDITQMDLIRILAGVGATRQEIADLLGTSPGTVATTLTRLRKKGELGAAE